MMQLNGFHTLVFWSLWQKKAWSSCPTGYCAKMNFHTAIFSYIWEACLDWFFLCLHISDDAKHASSRGWHCPCEKRHPSQGYICEVATSHNWFSGHLESKSHVSKSIFNKIVLYLCIKTIFIPFWHLASSFSLLLCNSAAWRKLWEISPV